MAQATFLSPLAPACAERAGPLWAAMAMAGAPDPDTVHCDLESSGSGEGSVSGDEEAHAELANRGTASAVAALPNGEASPAVGSELGANADFNHMDGPALTCLLGPKQRQKALLQKQRQKKEEREARGHWVQRWREYTKLHPEVIGKERDEMKAVFDEMQAYEMRADALCRTPKAHFSAVMSDLRRSRAVKDRELGTWRGYEPSRPNGDGEGKGRRRPRNRQRDRGAKGQGGQEPGAAAAAEGPAPEPVPVDPKAPITGTVSIGKGLLEGLSGQAAAEFGRDLYILQTKFTISVVVDWEKSRLNLEGARDKIEGAKKELVAILRHYFPGEAFDDIATREKPMPKHWTDTITCNLTEAQKAKVLAQTQEDREKQRNAVLYWGDRWEAWVKANPDLVQSTRANMKEGFERMLAAELGNPDSPGKVHFGLVMNFLRQSGRRQIAVWKDYAPKDWNG
uniref:Uncharacterized protein n=1 Tax=Alexandrium monilatum TaxID=311494 RepID=A0A7S4QAF2_9DINO